MEDQKGLTPADAILDFEARYFHERFKGVTAGDRGYYRCDRAIRAAKAGQHITFSRAKGILQTFAPGKYLITEVIKSTP